jgi:large subunit ribosomal protein L33|tara:strand:- start:497 stop:871 length:375 start_codon:yes stop_codon:yes gene_type:complete
MEKANETRRKSRHSPRADPVRRTEKMSSMTMSTVSSALSARRAVAAPVAARAPVVAAPAQRGSLVVVAASKKKDVRLTITLECTEQKESGVPGMSRYMTQKVSAAPAPRRNESRRSSAAGHRSG